MAALIELSKEHQNPVLVIKAPMLGAGCCSLVSPCTQSLGYGPSQNVAAAPEDVGLRGALGFGASGFWNLWFFGFRVLNFGVLD